MRLLGLTAAALVLVAWVAASYAQQEPQPAPEPPGTESAPPAAPPPAAPDDEETETPPTSPGEDVDEEFIPTEELQPDAAVTFPVDI